MKASMKGRPKRPVKLPHARVLLAMDLLRQMRWPAARDELMKSFKISRTTAAVDLARADAIIAEEIRAAAPNLGARSLERLTRMMDNAEARGDIRGAVMAQREITRIAGIASPVNMHHTGRVSLDLDKLSDEELAESSNLSKDILVRAAARAEAAAPNGKTSTKSDTDDN